MGTQGIAILREDMEVMINPNPPSMSSTTKSTLPSTQSNSATKSPGMAISLKDPTTSSFPTAGNSVSTTPLTKAATSPPSPMKILGLVVPTERTDTAAMVATLVDLTGTLVELEDSVVLTDTLPVTVAIPEVLEVTLATPVHPGMDAAHQA